MCCYRVLPVVIALLRWVSVNVSATEIVISILCFSISRAKDLCKSSKSSLIDSRNMGTEFLTSRFINVANLKLNLKQIIFRSQNTSQTCLIFSVLKRVIEKCPDV